MRDGAWGLSTGLIYNPGTYAKTDEIVELAKVAARHGGIYASHIRHEEAGLLDAIQEAITVGKVAGLPAHISHIKCSGRRMWGKSGDAIAMIEAGPGGGPGRHGRPVSLHSQQHIATGHGDADSIPRRQHAGFPRPARRHGIGVEDSGGHRAGSRRPR